MKAAEQIIGSGSPEGILGSPEVIAGTVVLPEGYRIARNGRRYNASKCLKNLQLSAKRKGIKGSSDSNSDIGDFRNELLSIKDSVGDESVKGVINKLIGRFEGLGKLSAPKRKKDEETLTKDLKTARKEVLKLLTPEKLRECKAMDLGRLLTIVDDRIRLIEGEGQGGSYERRITISGDVKGRNRAVTVTEKVTTDRQRDGYMGPAPMSQKVDSNAE